MQAYGNGYLIPLSVNSANRTLIPIHCTVMAPLSDFDGSWTVSDSFRRTGAVVLISLLRL